MKGRLYLVNGETLREIPRIGERRALVLAAQY